jgi:hypothetical protein
MAVAVAVPIRRELRVDYQLSQDRKALVAPAEAAVLGGSFTRLIVYQVVDLVFVHPADV